MTRSPCTGDCAIIDGLCNGCKRTEGEIISWRDMSDEEKQQVLAEIQDREYPTARE